MNLEQLKNLHLSNQKFLGTPTKTPDMQRIEASVPFHKAQRAHRAKQVADAYQKALSGGGRSVFGKATLSPLAAFIAAMTPTDTGDATTMPKKQPSLDWQRLANLKAIETMRDTVDFARQQDLAYGRSQTPMPYWAK